MTKHLFPIVRHQGKLTALRLYKRETEKTLLVEGLDLLYFVIAAHKDTRLIMNVLRHNLHHPFHLAVYCKTTSYQVVLVILLL